MAKKSISSTSLVLLLLLSCVEAEVAEPTYEVGQPGTLIIRNGGALHMAVGGCNPVFYQERLPGRWVLDGFIRPACAFFTSIDGTHTLYRYTLIPPHGSIEVQFPTDWLASTPGIMRVSHRVSTLCEPPAEEGAPLTCRGVEGVTTDPIVIFEPGTTETIDRR